VLSRQFLLSAQLLWDKVEDPHVYPFTLPILLGFDKLEFHPKVTFLVGENGAGKSTLLESFAVAYGLNAEGGSKDHGFRTRESHSQLEKYMRLAKGLRRPKDSFFLRAESFYNFATFADDVTDLSRYGGRELHGQSHGESFMSIFLNRLQGEGLYFFDEPEAALSPTRQLAFLSRLHELAQKDAQFIIATHSPIILAYPDAQIFFCGESGIERQEYTDVEHYQITRQFLNNPASMLKRLLEPQTDFTAQNQS
jgi:predicted ATPase